MIDDGSEIMFGPQVVKVAEAVSHALEGFITDVELN
jgi:hypothetical protein